jgi:hypothetical protein
MNFLEKRTETPEPKLLSPSIIYDIASSAKVEKTMNFFSATDGDHVKSFMSEKPDIFTGSLPVKFALKGIMLTFTKATPLFQIESFLGSLEFICNECKWVGVPEYIKSDICPKCGARPIWSPVNSNTCILKLFIGKTNTHAIPLSAIPMSCHNEPVSSLLNYLRICAPNAVIAIKPNERIRATLSWPLRTPKVEVIGVGLGLIGATYKEIKK